MKSLQEEGIVVTINDRLPEISEEDFTKSLEVIWSYRVEGWWHYKDAFVENGICTKEEFQ